MRTSDQIKRKYNELAAQKKALEAQRSATEGEGAAALDSRIGRLEEQMLLLEWVLNEPLGSYHG
ncbi:hypothetical protein J19TS2_03230 [Cohnella xylanilytica]|uniref:hypothetical protein n=1 Tax=Cohnella xylanilytica TaxID=557555 RepID=UPI001B2D6347|nr:hypothetical protein J19TS2_03230 [Cohnella xylanilytica]